MIKKKQEHWLEVEETTRTIRIMPENYCLAWLVSPDSTNDKKYLIYKEEGATKKVIGAIEKL